MTSLEVNFQHAEFELTGSESWAIKIRIHLNSYPRYWCVILQEVNCTCYAALLEMYKHKRRMCFTSGGILNFKATINMSLFKVPRPLTYTSLPLLPPEGLWFPRGPHSGFHHHANKAACIRPKPRHSRETWHLALRTKQHCFPLKGTSCLWKQCVYGGGVCAELSGKKGKETERKTHNFPVCGISVSVLELIYNVHPAKFGVSWGRGLPVDQDIIV